MQFSDFHFESREKSSKFCKIGKCCYAVKICRHTNWIIFFLSCRLWNIPNRADICARRGDFVACAARGLTLQQTPRPFHHFAAEHNLTTQTTRETKQKPTSELRSFTTVPKIQRPFSSFQSIKIEENLQKKPTNYHHKAKNHLLKNNRKIPLLPICQAGRVRSHPVFAP